jgi:hypothetical protein
MIPSTILDDVGNTMQHFSNDDERRYFSVLQHCGFVLDTVYFILLRAILFLGIRRGVFSFSILGEQLTKRSWLGKPVKFGIGGEVVEYRWLDQLLPAFFDYFANVEAFMRFTDFKPGLVLPIDSLAAKVEGMIRDICRMSGVSTTEVREDRAGRTISSEKNLHSLLYDPVVAELFDRDDLLFLRFLLVEKAGYGIRHKVAHSMMKKEDYSLKILHFLLLAVLRIGRYDLGRPAEANQK